MVSPHLNIKFCLLMLLLALLTGCAKEPIRKTFEATAYCGCSKCCRWERGSWKYLKLNFWNKYINYGKYAGRPYSGRTASGTKPNEPQEGLFSLDSIYHPWLIPFRILPWYILPADGTIAADTKYYPFGTRMYVPGYGWGVVEDRGSAIKGPSRIDLFFDSHREARRWGRRKVRVQIERP
ncbi:MAG: hypothetical protein CSB24_01455 [Deltaproteobacteria bacterium]|nr:MAG: hypothetical protein CSB24_01455 [Deltaproteobacteria bacterium]